jgi:alpha-beta hydrolase superfamily lysophospholipase
MRTREQRVLNQVQRPGAYREVLIESAGTTSALSVWDGAHDAPAVLFLPGTMTHPLFYEEFLDALNLAGLSVVGLHPAGHGKSPRLQRPRRQTFQMLVDNALDALGWMRETYPSAPLLVIGSSQGGVLAMAVAASSDQPVGVYAHNVLDPALASSLSVTRVPAWLAPAYPQLRGSLRLLAKVAPRLRVPFDAYLEMRRVSQDPAVKDYFYTDPLGLRSYPLGLLGGMLANDLPGPARCPVVVLAASGDPLFSLDYTREVFDRIDAPAKELVVVEADQHLLFNEALDVVLPVLLPRLLSHAGAGSSLAGQGQGRLSAPREARRPSSGSTWPGGS